jgi:hypothetical protein
MFRHLPTTTLTWILTLAVAGVTAFLGAALLGGDNDALDHAISAGWSPAATLLIGAAEIAAAGLLLFPRSASIGGAALAGVLASTPGAQLLVAGAQPNAAGVLGVATMSLAVALLRVPDLVEALLDAGWRPRAAAPRQSRRVNQHEDALEAMDGLAGECAGC